MFAIQKGTYDALENPKKWWEKTLTIGLMGLIFLSIFALAIEQVNPDLYLTYQSYFDGFDTVVFTIFCLEYIVRVLVWPNPAKYIFSFSGLIDLLAVAPRLLTGVDSGFVRGLRLMRFLRVLKLLNIQKRRQKLFSQTILAQALPFLFVAFMIKLVIFLLEANGWWISVENLETIFAVIGFAIGVILTQKLGIGYGKIIVVEDSVIKVVGVLKSLRPQARLLPIVQNWSRQFESVLKGETTAKERFGEADENLAITINNLSEGSGKLFTQQSYQELCKETEFIFNRMEIETDPVYDTFLRRITVLYSFMLIVFMPGLIGLISVLFATYVLGGLYFVIDDMDRAIGFDQKALINADISEIEKLNKSWK